MMRKLSNIILPTGVLVVLLAVGYMVLGPPGSAVVAERPGEIVVQAAEFSGHHKAWESRPYYGLPTWGIRGSGKVESGSMWFDNFPGPSGRYEIKLHALFEQDGSAPARVTAGDRVLWDAHIPYAEGKKNCKARGKPGYIDLGIHQIEQGEKITVWAESIYECGEKGAYALWHAISFVPAD